jgi:hypothetical protein
MENNGIVISDNLGAPGGKKSKAQAGEAAQASDVRAPSIGGLLSSRGRSSELSQKGMAYIEALTEQLTKTLGKNVEVVRIQDRIIEVWRVTYNKHTMLLTFSENYKSPADTHIPPTDQIGPAAKATHDAVGGVIHNNIVVNPEDYAGVNTMATHIVDIFTMANNSLGSITVDSFRTGRYSISTNLTEVRDVIRRFNPKAVMPRTDIGFVLYYTEDVPVAGAATIKSTEPILVVGAYTNFISSANSPNSYALGVNTPSFMSVVSITSILSPFPTPEMIALAIPLAAEEFIRRNGWLKPYTKFGQNDPNLGSLILDEGTGKPFFIENMNVLVDFVKNNISRPYLAIDVTDGHARIPGIESLRYGDSNAGSSVRKGVARLLGITEDKAAGNMVFQRFIEYIGELANGDDSRNVDYINLVAAKYTDMNILLRYLYVGAEPQIRASIISKIYDMKSLYTNARIVLDAQYVDYLSDAVVRHIRPMWDNANLPENNIGALGTGAGNEFRLGPVFGTGGAASAGWSGFTSNPFG